jgi:hypothetical protein
MELNSSVTEYIEKLDSPQRETCQALRGVIESEFPQLREDFKWSRPVYGADSADICYFVALKNDVNFGFNQGAELDDPKGILKGTGKQMRHIKLKKSDDIDRDYLTRLIQQAIDISAR